MSARRVLRTGGLWFDGKTAYVSTTFGVRSYPVTVVLWAYYSMLPTTHYTNIISQGISATDRTWHLGHSRFSPFPFRVVVYFTDGTNLYFLSDTAIMVGVWYHITLIINVDSAHLYINGMLDKTVTYSGTLKTTGNIEIGRLAGSLEYHNGIIDEVRIYNRALSYDEIKAIYERDEPIKDGLVLYLDFSEYEGNIAYDKSGTGNNGTIYGGARWVIKKAPRVLASAR